MDLIGKAGVRDVRNRIYYHNPYVLKKTSVELIHFFEKFYKYELYNQTGFAGAAEQIEWERLLFVYLEQLHSYIDLRNKIEKQLVKHCGLDRDEFYSFKKELLSAAPPDCEIVRKLRNKMHHEAIALTRIVSVGGGKVRYDAIPSVMWKREWFKDQEVLNRLKEIEEDPKVFEETIRLSFTSFSMISQGLGQKFDSYLNA